MISFANNEDPDALCCISSESTLFVKVKNIFRQKNTIFFVNYTLTPLGM